MSSILLGLAALANFTGFASGANFETTEACLLDALDENNVVTTKVDDSFSAIDYYGDVYNPSGENRYLEIQLQNGGWILYDKENYQTVTKKDVSPFCEAEFETLKLFDEDKLGFGYAYYDEDKDDFITNAGALSMSLHIGDYYMSQDKEAGNYYKDIPLSSTAHTAKDYYYFEKLGNMHAWNSKGTCTIVASEILFGYYDTFYSDLFVDEKYETRSHQSMSSANYTAKDFEQSPGVDNHIKDDHDFHDYLVDIARNEVGDDPEVDGMTTMNQIKLVNNYLGKQDISYKLNTSEGNLGDIWTQRAIGIIKQGIDEGRPVISNGSGHSTVAYAYDDKYVWVHTGWGWTGATPWSTYQSGLFANYSAGCIDLVYTGSHVHSDNYYCYNRNEYLCPCSQKLTSSTITPVDFGFDQRYTTTRELKVVDLDKLTLYTYRLRTGYIEEEYVNVSPKREGAGEAYLECFFSDRVRHFSINLSYWQILDKLSKDNSTAVLETYNGKEWSFAMDLIYANLSTDRTHQEEFSFSFIGKEIYAFRIRATAPATGDRNLGRISIGNINLIHEM